MGRAAFIAIGLTLNAAVLLVPFVMLADGFTMSGHAPAWVFLALASLFCLENLLADPEPRPVTPEGTPGGTRREQRGVQWRALAFGVTVLLVFWTALSEHFIASRGAGGTVIAMGGAMMIGGTALRHISIRALGKFFITEVRIEPGQPLLRSGPYRFVRHPSELGNLLVTLGAVVLLGSIAAAALWTLVLLPLSIGRIIMEDRILARHFPGEHDEHRHHTAALLPFVW